MKQFPNLDTIGKRSFLRIIPLIGLVVSLAIPSHGQVSFGGAPLSYQAEKQTAIASVVDYMTELPAINTDSLLAIDALPGNRVGGIKFAHTFFTNLSPENSGVTFTTKDGIRVWKVGVRSPGAFSLNVLFSEFLLPDGAAVYLYNKDRSCVLGAFTSKNRPKGGELSVSPVEGEELTIEYHEPVNASFRGTIRITEVNHDYLGLFRVGTRFNQLNLPCLPNASCDAAYDQLSKSTCLLIINGNTYCTGTLLNNTTQDGRPYLLTASHCLQNNPSLGSRVVAFLNYQSPRCKQNIRGSEEFSVSGSTTRALSNEIDFALLELDELPPPDYRPYLAGWSTDTLVTQAPYVSLHYPRGEVLKYALEENTPKPIDWSGTKDGIEANNHWLVERWEKGHTWYGSSGAPLFDNNQRLVGAMTGGDSGGENGCDTLYTGDFFFRFNRAWDFFSDSTKQLKHWLAPGIPDDSHDVLRLNGCDPYAHNPAVRLTNIAENDTLGALMVASPGKGSLVGQNNFGTSEYAEHFTTDSTCYLQGVYLMVYKGMYNNESPVVVSIYAGGDKPGALLERATLNLSYKDYASGRFIRITKTNYAHAENYLRFNNPVDVGNDFYISYRVDNTISQSDSFYVYAALREQTSFNTSWFASDVDWLPFSEHIYQPVNTSLWIEPIVFNDTLPGGNGTGSNNDTLQPGEPQLYCSMMSGRATIQFPEYWTGETTIVIYDLTGRRLYTQKGMPPSFSLDFNPSRRQLYLLRVSSFNRVSILRLYVP